MATENYLHRLSSYYEGKVFLMNANSQAIFKQYNTEKLQFI